MCHTNSLSRMQFLSNSLRTLTYIQADIIASKSRQRGFGPCILFRIIYHKGSKVDKWVKPFQTEIMIEIQSGRLWQVVFKV